MKKLLAAALLCALALPAAAQNAITQEGTTVKDAPVMLKGNNRARQGATVNGAPSGQIITTGDAVVGGRCDYSAPTDATDGYYRLCLDAKTGTIKLDGTKLPAQGTLKLEVNGTVYEMPASAAVVGSDAAVANNAALKLATSAAGKRLVRLGFTAAGDGGIATYNWSDANCTTADDGAQVQPGSTGCWIADFSAFQPVPEVWGAKGDGVADDAAAINAGLSYMGALGSGRLHARPGAKYGIGSTIILRDNTEFAGVNWDDSQIILLNGAFTPAIKMESRTIFRDWYIDGAPQSSGVIIQMGASGDDYRSYISRVITVKGCLALDVNGVSHIVRDSDFEQMSATAGCGGVRVGHATKVGTVELRFLDNLIKCDYTLPTRADYGMLLEDANGSFFTNDDNIGCIRGTIIKPGAGQSVDLNFFTAVALGDTAQEENLLVDTGDATATMRSNMFVNTWTSGATAPGGTGIRVKNTGGGLIDGLNFIGHRALQNFYNGVEIVSPVAGTISGVSFDGLRVCNTQVGSDVLVGNNLNFTIRNSRLGKACDGHTAGGTSNLLYGLGIGTNVQLIATGNDFSYGGAETWSPISGVPARNSVIGNNTPNTNAGPTYASASTVTLTLTAARIHLTGTTTVNTITPAWDGQPMCVISDDGVVNFGTSGNITAAVATSGVGGMVCGHYDSTYSKWYLH